MSNTSDLRHGVAGMLTCLPATLLHCLVEGSACRVWGAGINLLVVATMGHQRGFQSVSHATEVGPYRTAA